MGASPGVPDGLPQGRRRARARSSTCRGCGRSASAGSPLPPRGLPLGRTSSSAPDVLLNVGSGGTDVCTGIVQGSPLQPVWARRDLRAAASASTSQAFDEDGQRGRRRARRAGDHRADAVDAGRLLGRPRRRALPRHLLRRPTPASGATATGSASPSDGSCVITGRSDATLNRGGVRLGTAEFYRVVEELPEVADSLVVHLEDPAGGNGRAAALRRACATAPSSTTRCAGRIAHRAAHRAVAAARARRDRRGAGGPAQP